MQLSLNYNDNLRVEQYFYPKGVFVDFISNAECLQTQFSERRGWITCIYKKNNGISVLTFPSIEYFEEWKEENGRWDNDSELIYSSI